MKTKRDMTIDVGMSAVGASRFSIAAFDSSMQRTAGIQMKKGYGVDAIPVLRESLIRAGSPEIDAVTSSAITSNAVISAAKECLQMAGVIFLAWRYRIPPSTESQTRSCPSSGNGS